MKYKLKQTTEFKRNYKAMKKRGADMELLIEAVDILLDGKPLQEKYKDHALKGKYQGYRECHISPDWLLVYFVRDDILTLTLTATGTHSDLF